MNPVKYIYRLLKTGILDLIDDIKFLFKVGKKMRKGEQVVDPEKWNEYKSYMKTAPKEIIRKDWYWVIAIIFAVFIGWVIAAKFYQIQCNNFIVENYLDNVEYKSKVEYNISSPELPFIPSLPDSPSHETGEGQDKYGD